MLGRGYHSAVHPNAFLGNQFFSAKVDPLLLERKANPGRNCVSTLAPVQVFKAKNKYILELMVMALLVAVGSLVRINSVLFIIKL